MDSNSPIIVNHSIANEIRALREQQENLYFRDKAIIDAQPTQKPKRKIPKHFISSPDLSSDLIAIAKKDIPKIETPVESMPITSKIEDVLILAIAFVLICFVVFVVGRILDLSVAAFQAMIG